MSASDHFETPIFAARLRPHRSLDKRRVRRLLLCVGAASALASLPFVLIGAWPVIGFMGLDVLLLWLAFRASFKAATAYEDVVLTALQLDISKTSPDGARAEWTFSPLWVRLEKVEHPEFGVRQLALASRGRRLEIASFLGPEAKAEFGRAFSLALAKARRGPSFS